MPENRVNTPLKTHDDMRRTVWSLIQDLMGGTQAMRDADTDWLPMEDGESRTQYNIRLERSILYNAFRDTVEKLVSKPFSRPISTEGSLPPTLDPLLTNTDRMGQSLTQFGRSQFECGVTYGLGHFLVDFPPTTGTERLSDQIQEDIRPYFTHVSPLNLIGWNFVEENSRIVLDNIRIREFVEFQKEDFEVEYIEQVRVMFRDHWELYRLQGSGDARGFEKVDDGPISLGRVPLVTWYIKPRGLLLAEPPLEDLAWLNLAHWQSFSDQRNILRYARVPFLEFIGFDEDEISTVPLGANRYVRAASENARVSWVEPRGEAIALGQKDLDSLEARMEVMGLQPLLEKVGRATATGRQIDERHRETAIQAWIRSLESGLMDGMNMAAEWTGEDLPDDFKIHIFSEFGITARSQTDLDAIEKARARGDYDQETFLFEHQRRGVLDESSVIGDILTKSAAERAEKGPEETNGVLENVES